ncbi:hypothetical protein L21SP2_1398 [Salinispira pacifica]|uniref:Uncharacterized protein n=1 Tax=Salinispira pacifica TaxID=1307761 RepID=V5WG30_9SPIO|nr:hypothetical protein L21SP2_1398 [Salinispira pacifica]
MSKKEKNQKGVTLDKIVSLAKRRALSSSLPKFTEDSLQPGTTVPLALS